MDFKHTNLPIENELPKLVRDNIPDDIKRNNNIEPKYHAANQEEFKKYLLKKIVEEAVEVYSSTNRDELIEDLADVREIMKKIMEVFEISEENLEEIRVEKKQKRGGFDKKYILDSK